MFAFSLPTRGADDARSDEGAGESSSWLSASFGYAKPTIGVASEYARQACDRCEDLPMLGRAARFIAPHVPLEVARPPEVHGEAAVGNDSEKVEESSVMEKSAADDVWDTMTCAEVRSEVEFGEPEFQDIDFDHISTANIMSMFWSATETFLSPLTSLQNGVSKGTQSVKSLARDSRQQALNLTAKQGKAAGAAVIRTTCQQSIQFLVGLVRTGESFGVAPWQGVLIVTTFVLSILAVFALFVVQVVLASVSILAVISVLAALVLAVAVVLMAIGGNVSTASYKYIKDTAIARLAKSE
eukprot:TRINITY_DN8624_c0_g1_i1.p1 TRINITY_DN8624_c0_g1~~TRINITY_DN8624_c0_g1_i1.p1  ORF type:complete len:298 (+),score=39.66 TRINITY_DN8624_c0_g1_i1:72-965(+)